MVIHGLQTFSAGIPSHIGHAIGYLRQWFSLSTSTLLLPKETRTPLRSKHAGRCTWARVARRRWSDHLLRWLGWYPWQCKRCQTRSYFRARFWVST